MGLTDPSTPRRRAPDLRYARSVASDTWRRDAYEISTDPDRIDHEAVHRFLADSYWAADRAPDVIDRSLEGSLTFCLFHGDAQVGMARVVTDFATFAWLCDVYVEPAHRGNGLGAWLIEVVSGHPDLQPVGRWLLATSYSRSLYARFGFTDLPEPDRYMIRRATILTPSAAPEPEATGLLRLRGRGPTNPSSPNAMWLSLTSRSAAGVRGAPSDDRDALVDGLEVEERVVRQVDRDLRRRGALDVARLEDLPGEDVVEHERRLERRSTRPR